MSPPPHDFHPPTFSPFDHPTFDESVLYHDFSFPQKPLVPHSSHPLVPQERKPDQLFQDIQQLHESTHHTPQNDPRQPSPEPDQNEADPLKPLDALDILLHAPMDIEHPTDNDHDINPHSFQDHLLPGHLSSPVNVTSSSVIEEEFVPNSVTPKLDNFNLDADPHITAAADLTQQPQAPLFTNVAEPEDHDRTDAETADITMAELNAVIDQHVQESQLEERQELTAGKHPLDICEGTITPEMFPDILNPASMEGDATHNENTVNTTEIPPPKRQRRKSLTPTVFSHPTQRSLQRPFANLQASNHGQPSASERPRKRTRTRIEDMDPSMVHVCNFPGCTKKFAKKYNLKIHQRRHNGDLPFLCEYAGCAKRFMWLSSFSRHLRVHESRRSGGRRRREHVESGDPHNYDAGLEQEPDIAISDNFSILNVFSVKLFIENDLSEDVTFACALTALDSKPCETLIPVAQIAQTKRRQLLSTARSEEFCQQQAAPYGMDNAHLQNLCQLLSVRPDGMIHDSNSVF